MKKPTTPTQPETKARDKLRRSSMENAFPCRLGEVPLRGRVSPAEVSDNGARVPEPDAACRSLRNGTDGRRRKCRGFQGIWWCCCRDLNSGPLPYQGSALPLSYSSPSCQIGRASCRERVCPYV